MLSVPSYVKLPQLTFTAKAVLGAVVVGVTLLGILSRKLRRRRRPKSRSFRNKNPHSWKLRNNVGPPLIGTRGDGLHNYLDGDLRRSPSLATYTRGGPRSVSLASDMHSSASTITTAIPVDGGQLDPQQLGTMGMEALETAIGYWEDALSSYIPPTPTAQLAIPDKKEVEFTKQLDRVLRKAQELRDVCEMLFLHQTSVLFEGDNYSLASVSRAAPSSLSSIESFVSAHSEQIADLREFDEFMDHSVDNLHLELYQIALRQLEDGGIPYRIPLRTELLKCQSDVEYLAKLHCVRLAFQFLVRDDEKRDWFVDAGRQICGDILCRAERDPSQFYDAFEDMLEFVEDEGNWYMMEDELRGRGVKCSTFYDIVLDFIFLDAFEDLENPPSSVMAVIQNRWLSNSFKETALSTAVWSVLKAKKKLLKNSDGFIAKFYAISEHISPILAWGFLGPAEDLTDLCHFFKDQVTEYLQDIFSFQRVRYTTIQEMAEDVYRLARLRHELVNQRLSV